MLVSPVTQPEVIPLAPGPDHARLAEGETELCSTLNLDDPKPVELLHVGRHGAALAASSPQLPEVTVSPT